MPRVLVYSEFIVHKVPQQQVVINFQKGSFIDLGNAWISSFKPDCKRKRAKKRPVFIVFDYEGVRTVDAIGLETDFTLETNKKRMKEKLLKIL